MWSFVVGNLSLHFHGKDRPNQNKTTTKKENMLLIPFVGHQKRVGGVLENFFSPKKEKKHVSKKKIFEDIHMIYKINNII